MMKSRKYSDIIKRLIFISIVPFILLSLTIKALSDVYLREVFLTEHSKVAQSQVENFDEQMTQLEVAVDYLIYNLLNINTLPIEFNYQTRNNVSNTMGQLFLFENSNALVQSVQLYNLDEESDFATIIQSSGNRRMIESSNQIEYLRNITKQNMGWYYHNNTIQYIKILPNNISGFEYIVIQLDDQFVRSLLQNNLSDGASNFLFVNEQLVLTTTNSFKEVNESSYEDWIKQKNKYHLVEFELKHLNSNWKILSFYPIEAVLKPIRWLYHLVLLISILLLIGLLMYEYHIYNNVRNYVSNKMKELFGEEHLDYQSNEFELVATQWQILNDSKLELEKKVEDNHERLAASIIHQLMSGRADISNLSKIYHDLAMYGINPHEKNQICNLIMTEIIDENKNVTEDFEIMIKEELRLTYPNALLLKTSRNTFILFSHNGYQIPIDTEQLKAINQRSNRYITLVKGSEFNDVKQFQTELQKIYAYRTYQRLIPQNQLIDITRFNLPKLSYNVQSEQKIKHIIDQIKTADTIEVEKAYYNWLESILATNDYQFLLLQEIRKLYETLRITFPNFQVEFDDHLINQLFRNLLYVFNKQQIGDIVWERIMHPIIKKYVQGNQADLELAVVQLKEYVSNYYMDRNLSLDEQASHLNVDVVQLSRYFKSKMGLNYIDYLTKIRLEKAKQLLVRSSMPIKEVAENVGYEPAYFNRIFKKYFNLTPGQYRKDHQ